MTGGTGYCGVQKSLDLFIGIFNLFLDVTVVVLPMPVLWGLKMAVGKKVMLSGMFGMGTAYVPPLRASIFYYRHLALRDCAYWCDIVAFALSLSIASTALPRFPSPMRKKHTPSSPCSPRSKPSSASSTLVYRSSNLFSIKCAERHPRKATAPTSAKSSSSAPFAFSCA